MTSTTLRVSARRARARWLPLLLLPLSACDALAPCEDCTGLEPCTVDCSEDGPGTLRARYGSTWRSYGERTTRLDTDSPGLLLLCGEDDPSERIADDESTLCIRLQLEPAVLGTGPVTLPFEGTAQVPPGLAPPPAFTPATGHEARVRAAWAWTGCFAGIPESPTQQRVRGTLTLTDNSATRLAGHLTFNAEGTLAGPCAGEAAEADLDFEVAR